MSLAFCRVGITSFALAVKASSNSSILPAALIRSSLEDFSSSLAGPSSYSLSQGQSGYFCLSFR